MNTSRAAAPRGGCDDAAAELALQELRWLLLSPPLLAAAAAHDTPAQIQHFTAAERLAIEIWLAALAQAPRPLIEHLQAASPASGAPLRLGRRAERLLEFFLRHGPTHRLVAANVPLRQPVTPGGDHTTRGEIDFLLEDAAGQPWHWELAVKFFLCTASGALATTDQFIGPDRAEVLAGKLDKLFTRQLRHHAPPPFDTRAWRPAAYARGNMFYRHGATVPRCEALAEQHARGWWIAREQAHTLPEGHYRLAERSQWMAAQQHGTLRDRDAMLAAIDQRWAEPPPRGTRRWPSAQMVVCASADEQGPLQLPERGFIVPPGWSETAA